MSCRFKYVPFHTQRSQVDAPCGKTKTTGHRDQVSQRHQGVFIFDSSQPTSFKRIFQSFPPWQSNGRKFGGNGCKSISQPWGKRARRQLAKVNRVHAKSPVKFHGNDRNCRNRQLSSHHYIAQSRLNLISKSPYFPHAVHVTWSRKMPCFSGTSGGM